MIEWRLTDGEYVIDAASAERYRPLFGFPPADGDDPAM